MKIQISGRCEPAGGALFALDILGRQYPNAPQVDDANWLLVRVEAALPGYRAAFDARLRAEDLLDLLRDLRQIRETGEGVAVLSASDEALELRGELAEGRVSWAGETVYPAPEGAVLSFAFTGDLERLPAVLSALEAACSQYPVVT